MIYLTRPAGKHQSYHSINIQHTANILSPLTFKLQQSSVNLTTLSPQKNASLSTSEIVAIRRVANLRRFVPMLLTYEECAQVER